MFKRSTEIKKKQHFTNGYVLAITAALLWGVSGTFAQFLFRERGINVEWLVTVRLLISGIIFLGIALFNKDRGLIAIWKNKRDVLQLLLFSICGMILVQYTYFAAIKHSNAATATVIQYAGPVIIAVYLAMKSRRWPSATEFIAIFLAVAGTFLLVTHGSFSSLSISGLALFWGILSAFALAFYTIQPVRLLQKYSSPVVIGLSMLIGGFFFSFFHAPWDVRGEWDASTFISIGFIILFATLIAFYAYLTAVKSIGGQKTSLLASAEPLSAAIISVVWLNVTFTAMDWLGSFFIISTIFLLTKQDSKKNKSSQL